MEEQITSCLLEWCKCASIELDEIRAAYLTSYLLNELSSPLTSDMITTCTEFLRDSCEEYNEIFCDGRTPEALFQHLLSHMTTASNQSNSSTSTSKFTSTSKSTSTSSSPISPQLQLLSDIFPHHSHAQLERALSINHHDIETTCEWMMEYGDTLEKEKENNQPKSTQTSTSTTSTSTSKSAKQTVPRHIDPEEWTAIKQRIAEKYTYDSSSSRTIHRPNLAAIKFEAKPKQHARYLNNQIVNTRGEKYTIIEDEEEKKRIAEYQKQHKGLKIITKRKGGKGFKIV